MSIIRFPTARTLGQEKCGPARGFPLTRAPDDLDEHTLVERVVRGDSVAFARVVDLFWAPLLAYTSRLLDDMDGAKDVVQSVFVRIWAERRHWKPRSLRAYLFRIVRNAALDQLRRRDARQRFVRGQSTLSIGAAMTPAQVMEDEELATAVDRAIQALPERRREVFTLGYLQGLSHKEIGDVLGVAPKTIANQMTIALAELRATLHPWLASHRESWPLRTPLEENTSTAG